MTLGRILVWILLGFCIFYCVIGGLLHMFSFIILGILLGLCSFLALENFDNPNWELVTNITYVEELYEEDACYAEYYY